MIRLARTCLVLAAVSLALTACSKGPPKRVFPPTASIQQLTVQNSGQWELHVRVQSFSNVPHTVSDLSAQLHIDGLEAGSVKLGPDITIGPQSAEIEAFVLQPSTEAASRIAKALESNRSATYQLRGTLTSNHPDKRRDNFQFEGQLWPVPGLTGVLR